MLADEVFATAGAQDKTLWAASDHLGSVHEYIQGAATTGTPGDLIYHLDYDDFGNISRVVNNGEATLAPSTADGYFAFAGRTWDEDAKLYYNRARWYDPATSRFLSEDPIGFAGGDANLYRYAGNDPANTRDPSGLYGEDYSYNSDWYMPAFDFGGLDFSWPDFSGLDFGGLGGLFDSFGDGLSFSFDAIGQIGSRLDSMFTSTFAGLNSMSLTNQLFSGQAQGFDINTVANADSLFLHSLYGIQTSSPYRGSWYENSWLKQGVDVSGAFLYGGVITGTSNIASALGNTVYELGAGGLDIGNDALATTTMLAFGQEWGYRGHYSSLGQALDEGNFTVGGYYKDAAITTAANTVSLGLYSQGRTLYQLYQGNITLDEASGEVGLNGLLGLIPAKAIQGTRYGKASPLSVPGMLVNDAKAVLQSALRRTTAASWTVEDFPAVGTQISQKQLRHIAGREEHKVGGYLNNIADAQKVLDAYHLGKASIIGRTNTGFPVVKFEGVTGTNVNLPHFLNQPTNVFIIKGTKSPSIVPTNPLFGQ